MSLNVEDEKELHLVGVKLDDDEESADRDVRRGFWEENLLRRGESRCFPVSARLKRGRNMQTGAGGRYAAALGRSKVMTCALRGAQSGSMLIRHGGVIVLSSHTFKSTASSEKQLHNGEFM